MGERSAQVNVEAIVWRSCSVLNVEPRRPELKALEVDAREDDQTTAREVGGVQALVQPPGSLDSAKLRREEPGGDDHCWPIDCRADHASRHCCAYGPKQKRSVSASQGAAVGRAAVRWRCAGWALEPGRRRTDDAGLDDRDLAEVLLSS